MTTEYHRTYREKNRQAIRERNRQRYLSDPNVQFKRQVKSANANPEKTLWASAKANARRAGREFSIEVCDIVIPEVCPYLGVPLQVLRGEGIRPYAPSVDRIDSTKGYIKGNVEVISKKANLMKNNASREELILFAKHILSTYYDE